MENKKMTYLIPQLDPKCKKIGILSFLDLSKISGRKVVNRRALQVYTTVSNVHSEEKHIYKALNLSDFDCLIITCHVSIDNINITLNITEKMMW